MGSGASSLSSCSQPETSAHGMVPAMLRIFPAQLNLSRNVLLVASRGMFPCDSKLSSLDEINHYTGLPDELDSAITSSLRSLLGLWLVQCRMQLQKPLALDLHLIPNSKQQKDPILCGVSG